MSNPIQIIPLQNLALAFIPVVIVILILWNWKLKYMNSIYAVFRMLIQLFMIGYFLVYIFEEGNSMIVLIVLAIMLFASSIIALRTVQIPKRKLYFKSFLAIFISGGIILLLITQGVLGLHPWYLPSYMIPLAGMIFANAMNSVSIAVERLDAETKRDIPFAQARNIALQASLIPITNSLFAVGLVSLPGMMTGQILSGVSPFIAARYQIMVMCMIYGSAGISAAIFLTLIKSYFVKKEIADQLE